MSCNALSAPAIRCCVSQASSRIAITAAANSRMATDSRYCIDTPPRRARLSAGKAAAIASASSLTFALAAFDSPRNQRKICCRLLFIARQSARPKSSSIGCRRTADESPPSMNHIRLISMATCSCPRSVAQAAISSFRFSMFFHVASPVAVNLITRNQILWGLVVKLHSFVADKAPGHISMRHR
ncbi:Uncharacterised protein [Serratia rubidaea]|uniref:Uncharacterized protein n=1 Tax=Serratia rubidaea TaxID=61652 RepID=A0A4U9HEK2_SERRU|nr:Uncharacterised protein [Serratia rubidaea]